MRRLAAKVEATVAAPKETWSAKALRIAAHYLDDPDRWARQDKYGKGLTACQREVEPDFYRKKQQNIGELRAERNRH